MKTACLECHRLEFEPAVTTRQVAHGAIDEVVLTIKEFYANIALNNIPVDVADIGEIRRGLPRFESGAITDEQRLRALAWAKAKAQKVAADLIEVRVCIVCHQVTRTVQQSKKDASIAWNVAPVHVASTWLPAARFDHDRHRTTKCADCHPVARSHVSGDISIPDIGKCRECHAGDAPVPNKVVSTCVSCHDFHLPGHASFGARVDATLPDSRRQ